MSSSLSANASSDQHEEEDLAEETNTTSSSSTKLTSSPHIRRPSQQQSILPQEKIDSFSKPFPPEVLSAIFGQLPPSSWKSIALSCRQVSDLIEPFSYRKLNITFCPSLYDDTLHGHTCLGRSLVRYQRDINKYQRLVRPTRTTDTRPKVDIHVKELSLGKSFLDAGNHLHFFSHLRRLFVQPGLTTFILPKLASLASIRLDFLAIAESAENFAAFSRDSRTKLSFPWRLLARCMEIPSLRELSVDNLKDTWLHQFPEIFFPPKLSCQSNVTSLQLRSFEIKSLYYVTRVDCIERADRYYELQGTSDFKTELHRHKDSLEELALCLPRSSLGKCPCFDQLASFPKLRRLAIPHTYCIASNSANMLHENLPMSLKVLQLQYDPLSRARPDTLLPSLTTLLADTAKSLPSLTRMIWWEAIQGNGYLNLPVRLQKGTRMYDPEIKKLAEALEEIEVLYDHCLQFRFENTPVGKEMSPYGPF